MMKLLKSIASHSWLPMFLIFSGSVNATTEQDQTDTIAPLVFFSPSEITLFSGQLGESELNFSDNNDSELTPDIYCDQGGLFSNNQFIAPETRLSRVITCTAQVTDSSQNQASAILKVNLVGTALTALDINPFNLPNYADQFLPNYIIKDNTDGNEITDIGATLGRVLFYDKKLSTDNNISCASCHQQQFAFSDPQALSRGVNGLTRRHSMRLVNTRFSNETRFFWDERAESLEAQTTMPIRDFTEMGFSGENGAPNFDDLIEKLSSVEYYQDLFTLAFGDAQITEERMQQALAQFIRSIQSFDSKYDIGRSQVSSHAEDFPNFTPRENAGKRLFTDSFDYITDTIELELRQGDRGRDGVVEVSKRISGGANCASCHRPPEFDIDPTSLNNGVIRVAGADDEVRRRGRDIEVTRSPSLRDLINLEGELNGGMFHAGQTAGLGGVIGHYNFIRNAPQNTNIDPRLMPGGLPQFLDLSGEERRQLVAFLRTLSGTNVYLDQKWSNPFN